MGLSGGSRKYPEASLEDVGSRQGVRVQCDGRGRMAKGGQVDGVCAPHAQRRRGCCGERERRGLAGGAVDARDLLRGPREAQHDRHEEAHRRSDRHPDVRRSQIDQRRHRTSLPEIATPRRARSQPPRGNTDGDNVSVFMSGA